MVGKHLLRRLAQQQALVLLKRQIDRRLYFLRQGRYKLVYKLIIARFLLLCDPLLPRPLPS